MIWGGSSLNIYNDTEEIRRRLILCVNAIKIKKIFAICWGYKVAVAVAGGEVKKSINGAHRGIAHDILINKKGSNHPMYINKRFNLILAFNFDEI